MPYFPHEEFLHLQPPPAQTQATTTTAAVPSPAPHPQPSPSPPTPAPAPAAAAPAPSRKPLSCTNCRQRKTKCDRASPCANCRRYGLQCVAPPRLRRPRLAGTRSELLTRIGRLEGLVGRLDDGALSGSERGRNDAGGVGGGGGGGADAQPALVPATSMPTPTPTSFPDSAAEPRRIPGKPAPQALASATAQTLVDSYSGFVQKQSNRSGLLGGEFWTTLSAEVGEIRELLEHDSGDDEDDDDGTGTSASASAAGAPAGASAGTHLHFMFAGPRGAWSQEYVPSVAERNVLAGFYFANVHPVCRVLHEPTSRLHLTVAEDLYGVFPSMKAVTFASGLLAVISMTPEECFAHLGQERAALLVTYRQATELALSQADFMGTIEILTIQALVLYIVRLLRLICLFSFFT